MPSLKLSKTTLIEKVPTNIVTGFLGSGKSTLIQSLLTNKDNDEHWVILINEFGEVGLDEQIIEATVQQNNKQNPDQSSKKGQIQISQIAGGCLCCANGVPFQVALVQLLKQQDKSPDRLIIEPTGLGHPKQIINQLASQPFIDLQTVFSVVDPRKITDARYAEHELFTTQIAVANVVVCNKNDVFEEQDLTDFERWMSLKNITPNVLVQTSQGIIDEKLLSLYRPKPNQGGLKLNLLLNNQSAHSGSVDFMEYQPSESKEVFEPIQVFEQNVEGFYALGLIFDETFNFEEDEIINELMDIDMIRIKALIKTQSRVLVINSADNVMTQTNTDDPITQSRFQFISHDPISIERIKRAIIKTNA